MEKHRVTQQMIAERAGVHRTTVSMAIKGHPSIPKETRERILRLVEELGYAPDPMLSALAIYRNSNRPVHFHGTLAWLVHSPMTSSWRRNFHFKEYFAGAVAQARLHGYELEVFEVNHSDMPSKRVAAILRARNISGILLCPQRLAHTKIEFPLEDFCAVTFGYSLEEPKLHTVASTHYRSLRRVFQEVWRRGYRRIGFVGIAPHDSKVDNSHLAAYLVEQALHAGEIEVIPHLYRDQVGVPDLVSWFKAHRPDAIVSSHPDLLAHLKTARIRFPKVGIGFPGLPGPHPDLAGVTEESVTIGATAVDLLVSLVQHGQRGIPAHPRRVHVEGVWNEGRSLRPPPR